MKCLDENGKEIYVVKDDNGKIIKWEIIPIEKDEIDYKRIKEIIKEGQE